MTEVIIKDHLVHVSQDSEFATFTRRPSGEEHLQQITLSFPPTPAIADRLDKSGIVEVVSYSGNGTMLFRRNPFYETHLFVEILADAIKHHISKTNGDEQH